MRTTKVITIIAAFLVVVSIPFILYGTAIYVLTHFVKKFW
jgi:hypothetical protein